MASYTQGDTHPPLRGWARDETGELVNLALADELLLILKSTGATITGVPTVLDPVEVDAGDASIEYNWEYEWAADDTSATGTYEQALKVTWDNTATPPTVEYFPSSGAGPTLTIKAKLG